MSEDTDSEQTAQTAEDTQVQDSQVGDVSDQTSSEGDGGLRPIDHQIINRLKDVEKAIKKPAQQTIKTEQTNKSSPDSKLDQRLERQDLRLEGYSKDEVDFLMQNGGHKALDNSIVMAGIEAMRKKAKSTEATPAGTGKSTVYQKFTEQDLKKMSAEELEKIVPQ